MVYRQGADAPPRPTGWDRPAPTRPPRPGWRSPYRLVPVALAVILVVVGLVQALGSAQPVTSAVDRARALQGKCLSRTGTIAGVAAYSATAVACAAPDAAVKVVATIVGPAGSGHPRSCPVATTLVELLCVEPVRSLQQPAQP